VGLAPLVKARRHDPVGGGERGVDVAVAEDAMIRPICRDRLVHERLAQLLGSLRIDHGRQRLVLDRHQRAGVFDLVRGRADHAGDGVAHEADLLSGQDRHLHRQQAVDGRRHPEWSDELRQVRAGQDRLDAGRSSGRVGVDAADAGVGVRAAHERGVQHLRLSQIADVGAAPQHELPRLAGADRRADVPFGRLGHRAPPGSRGPIVASGRPGVMGRAHKHRGDAS
jgi:hypothetical protein